ncbi:tyrosine-protein kinase receptor UFO isoform X2 [Carettochelys insculpta]|uniref:tyrosine-protein kinase receptor UFO isoform X2 n=1 Tax=Carettochelys insculpta TaxID=44489 RepID=UPI003EC08488
MGPARCSLLSLLLACGLGAGAARADLHFLESPSNLTSSLGKDVRLRCAVQLSHELPDISWRRDGQELELADSNQMQVPINEQDWLAISELSIPSVQLSDAGSYQCAVWVNGEEVLSDAAHLGLEGLNRSASFSCEAHNAKGVATSRTAAVTVVPQRPRSLGLVTRSDTALEVGWEPGTSGESPLRACTVQAVRTDQDLGTMAPGAMYSQNANVPPFRHLILGLAPFATYHVRVACLSGAGASRWTHWVPMETLEGAPRTPPQNVTAFQNGSHATVHWLEPRRPLGGVLRGYKLAYHSPDSPEVVVDVGLTTEKTLELASEVQNLTVRVAPYTSAGDGPWSDAVVVSSYQLTPRTQQVWESAAPTFSWHWWAVVLAVALAVAFTIFLLLVLARLRKKETQFGEAFEPRVERGELVVHYRVRKSYSRRATEATLNSLGISEELREKLRDVMVERHRVALGKTLGEGEFGSVMEGQLNQDDCVLKVAVKTMKIAICTRSEMEDFLNEAVCMKDFDHPNVMKLLGVCLQSTESEGYPSPVVILPFMKHGDLHSFLLYSRLGESPVYLPAQTLVRFMADIASGMHYLSSRNFIHRDLAARNCMLNENMNVCVADFGLSKKIYNGDYYRQGRIAKMPVKWIAIESLADRVYTTKSDVWSFGVTMWEIATRGQTPYPGVENSEIYDYLRQGHRLKQPLDCLDGLYQLMSSCWALNPKERPSFEVLHGELEKILQGLPPAQGPDEILYVNMEDGGAELGAIGGLGPEQPAKERLPSKGAIAAQVHQAEGAGRYVLCPAPPEGARRSGDPPPLPAPCAATEEGA